MLSSLNFQTRYYKPVKARRVSRACDECRKRKTKCIVVGQQCQTCILKKVYCTFHFPSCKRGPKPKSNDSEPSNNLLTEPNQSYLPMSESSSYFSLPTSSSHPVSPNEKESHYINYDNIYWLDERNKSMVQYFFQFMHPLLPIVDPNYLFLGLSQNSVSPSFQLLLQSILQIVYHYGCGSDDNLPYHIPTIPTNEFNDDYLSLNHNLVMELFTKFPIYS